MIGNDIVDLALAQKESNWQRKRFFDKLFTANEQHLILSSDNPEKMVWNLWSKKEAAYKIYNRESGKRIFNPIQFVCETDSVTFGNFVYHTQTEITPDFIYTIAVTSKADFSALQHQNAITGIQKNNGIPNWLDVETKRLLPASVTHHGRFLRIAVLR